MNHEENNNERSQEQNDIRAKTFEDEEKNLLRTHELKEADIFESLDRRRDAHDAFVQRKASEADLVQEIEGDRIKGLRMVRLDLDTALNEATEVVKEAFKELGLVYTDESTKEDLYALDELHPSEAAEKAGVPGVFEPHVEGVKFLKAAGMVGCIVLGTVGLGALILRVPPRLLITSPLELGIAASISFILVGGSYLLVNSQWKRIGTCRAGGTKNPETQTGMLLAIGLTGATTLLVAGVDAKAITAINATRALINPALAPSPAVVFLVAMALSGAYVMGASALAFYEAYAKAVQSRIAGAQHRHKADRLTDRREYVEVQNACEALSNVITIKARRKALAKEIEDAEAELTATLAKHFTTLPMPPEMPEEHRKDLRVLNKKAQFARWKAAARHLFKPNMDRYGKGSGEARP